MHAGYINGARCCFRAFPPSPLLHFLGVIKMFHKRGGGAGTAVETDYTPGMDVSRRLTARYLPLPDLAFVFFFARKRNFPFAN